jgi:hypothetical protein
MDAMSADTTTPTPVRVLEVDVRTGLLERVERVGGTLDRTIDQGWRRLRVWLP